MATSAPSNFARRLKSHLDEADQSWFERHPDARWRRRLYVPGEADVDPPATHVIVTRHHGGGLRRIYRRDDAA